MSRTRPPRLYRAKEVTHTCNLRPDGMPDFMLTDAVLVGLEQLTSSIEYVFDTPEVEVEGVTGCTASPVRPDYYDHSLHAVDLALCPRMPYGIERPVSYRTTFRYTRPPANELRQGGGTHGIDKVKLVVRFGIGKPPQRVWWTLMDYHTADAKVVATDHLSTSVVDANKPTERIVGKLTWEDLKPSQVIGVHWDY